MTITSSPTFLSTSGAPVRSAVTTARAATNQTPPSTGLDAAALIIGVAGQLGRSADPETVFGSLATAYARHTGTRCTVELLIGGAIRVIEASPPAGSEAAAGPVVSEQAALSSAARQLLAGNGAPLSGPDWFALAIGAVACQDAGAEIPVGAFTCHSSRHAGQDQLEPARFLLTLATDQLQAERRLARAQSQAANLEIALASNRDIGTAIGILMNAHLVTQEQAFAMLRTASQHGHRKLREIANEVIFTGALETPRTGPAAAAQPPTAALQ